jgi:hypothetical protein
MTDASGAAGTQGAPTATASAKPWWATLTEFLALPAIIILMFMQFTEGNVNRMTPAQIEAQIAASRAAEAKDRAETQEVLDRLQVARSSGSQKEFQKSIADLQSRLDHLGSASTKLASGKTVIETFVLLWIVNMVVGLGLDVLHYLWGMLTGLVFSLSNTLISRHEDRMYQRREAGYRSAEGLSGESVRQARDKVEAEVQASRDRMRFLRGALTYFGVLSSVVVNLVSWSVRVAVFLALFVPFFDMLLRSTGSSASLAWTLEPVRGLDFAAFLDRAQSVVFGSGSPH